MITVRVALFLLIGALCHAKPFVTVHFLGQLGNQMFQIATASAVAWDHDADPLFPELSVCSGLDIPKNSRYFFYNVKRGGLPRAVKTLYKETGHEYAPIPYAPDLELSGYFQSEKYFSHHKGRILKLFAPHPVLQKRVNRLYGKLLKENVTVGLHVRTYNREDPSHEVFALCSRSYFEEAVALFPEDALFIVCSDDIGWCKRNLSGLCKRMLFVEGNSYEIDFWLLSFCHHQIITNSTFSWWAAYLNKNPEKIVVAPRKWFTPRLKKEDYDIVPEDWITLDN
ncbi:MAG: alpha-1,2-fucosyltransferase [Chlamydiia bacterium]|nr:alpha-1,2-fucosyltransferase [Chlamydiia bacterium]